MNQNQCNVELCEKPVQALGWCSMHYARVRKHGTTDAPMRLTSTIRDQTGNKRCRKCDHWLPEDQFPRSKASADGRHSYCTWCMNLARFKLNRNTYADLLADQDGVCKICRGSQWGDGNKFAVDHDHNCCTGDRSCGECIRGLLCNACNSALGMMEDDVTRLRAAADYLERSRRDERS